MKKEEFLSSESNKSRCLKALGCYLQEKGLKNTQAKSNADLLNVLTAVEFSRHSMTIVIGDDTDLLVLLLHHASSRRIRDKHLLSNPIYPCDIIM